MKTFEFSLYDGGWHEVEGGKYMLVADHLADKEAAMDCRKFERDELHKQIAALEATVKEKEETISRLRNDLCDAKIKYENALTLCKERQEQIVALTGENKRLKGEINILKENASRTDDYISGCLV